MGNYGRLLKNLLFYQEKDIKEGFILEETDKEKEQNEQSEKEADYSKKKKSHNKTKDKGFIKKLLDPCCDEKKENEEEETKEEKGESLKDRKYVSKDISENLEFMKMKYSVPQNGDIVIREFDITVKGKAVAAFIMLIDGMTDRTVVNSNILHPLMLLSNLDIKTDEDNIGEYVRKRLIPQNQLKETREYTDIIDEINFGGCGIFVDGSDIAFTADVKGWKHRGVERPNTELVLRGPQEGFNEILRANTGLIRKILKNENLIAENIKLGKRSKTPCSLLYVKNIANDSLVNEVRRRLKSIKIDNIFDSGELEQLIEDSTFTPAPQVIATERPDRVAAMLTEGKIAVVMHGSPFVLVVPATLTAHLHSAEDAYIRFPYGNFLRYVRFFGVAASLLLPGIYIAITNFHQEMIPTDLLLAVVGARERVPFPSVVEILIMELAFELIREAGIRIPGPIGPTLGIIGALILGQAAVAANIVSPILIIVVAVTGIGSFAIPSFSLAYAFRILRFGFIALGAMAGFLGITLGVFIYGLILVSTKSFGVPFLTPLGPVSKGTWKAEVFRAPLWKQETRPDFLNAKAENKQSKISRGWIDEKDAGGDENEE